MLTSLAHTQHSDDRYLLVDDTDEDACEILTVICDGELSPAQLTALEHLRDALAAYLPELSAEAREGDRFSS